MGKVTYLYEYRFAKNQNESMEIEFFISSCWKEVTVW